jgi:hypothetical protein
MKVTVRQAQAYANLIKSKAAELYAAEYEELKNSIIGEASKKAATDVAVFKTLSPNFVDEFLKIRDCNKDLEVFNRMVKVYIEQLTPATVNKKPAYGQTADSKILDYIYIYSEQYNTPEELIKSYFDKYLNR